ncbi:MAG: hypothetical protein IPH04_22425 [Saprospirales bacterium]|nr:hypothetical protein [Saprospirales bacterium]
MKSLIVLLNMVFLLWCGDRAEIPSFQKKHPGRELESQARKAITQDTIPTLPVDYEVQLLGHQVMLGYQYLGINFIDRTNGKVVNTFDVVANQPFSFEGYEYMEEYSAGYHAYSIPESISGIASEGLRSKTVYNKDYEKIEPEVGLIYLRNWVSVPQYNNTKYTLVFYQILSFGRMSALSENLSAQGFRTGGRTSIIILNEKGESICVIKDIPEWIASTGFSITQDGKYLGVISGVGEDEDSPFIIPEKWHVIDVSKEKIIIEREESGGFLSSIFSVKPPYVVATNDKLVLNKNKCQSEPIETSSGEYDVFDFGNKIIFSRCYNKNSQGHFPWIWLSDGVIEKDFRTGLPERKLLYYSDFKQVPLSNFPSPVLTEKTFQDSLPLQGERDNIRFLQKIGDSLVYKPYWSGPLVAATFHDPETGRLLKTVPVRELNPYLNIGLREMRYPGEMESNVIDLHADNEIRKEGIKNYLPRYLYDEIPDDFIFQNAITKCKVGMNWASSERYIPFLYLLEWEPHYERRMLGSYGVTMVSIRDSTGIEVYRKQFDGLLRDVAVSGDGRYMAIAYTLYPDTGNDEFPRLKNCADLIYLPEDKVVWHDETPFHYEEYFFTTYGLNVLKILKIKGRQEMYNVYLLDTEKDVLFSKFMKRYEWRGASPEWYQGKKILQMPDEFIDTESGFQVQQLLEK